MMNALKTLFVGTARVVFNGAYQFQCKRQGPKRDKTVVFISRQMDVPSENFCAVGRALEQCGWNVVYHTKRLTKMTLLSYTAHVFQEIALLAQASAVVLDRYDPVISLLDFTCEEPEACDSAVNECQGSSGAAAELNATGSKAYIHHEFPTQPLVVQLWHAFGSFKKFGYQSLDTPEGHSEATARIFRIHRNYSWVICTSEDDRMAFAEAFAAPPERVVPLGLPEFDKLLDKRKCAVASDSLSTSLSERAQGTSGMFNVLFAPTLRKDPHSEHPFHDLESWWKSHSTPTLEPHWSYHPLERGVGAATDVACGLEASDVVVTDYSSLVYEAYVLGKPVLFYIPDIEAYRISPGLNADPLMRCPELCYTNPQALQSALVNLALHPQSYPHKALESFVGKAFLEESGHSAERIASFIDSHVATSQS